MKARYSNNNNMTNTYAKRNEGIIMTKPTIYGYARVSTTGQHLKPQIEQLKDVGATKIYREKLSGKNLERGKLQELLNELKAGDTLIVSKMDRLARNVSEGMALIDDLNSRNVTLNVLNMGVFDNSPTSKLIRNILLSVADWEREMILERQREGIEQAKRAGKYKGRPKTYTKNHKGLNHALELFDNRETNGHTVDEIAEMTGISKRTIYREAKKRTDAK